MKEKQIILRCSEEFKNSVKSMAEEEGLSMSAYITRLLKLQMNGRKENDTRAVPRKTLGKE